MKKKLFRVTVQRVLYVYATEETVRDRALAARKNEAEEEVVRVAKPRLGQAWIDGWDESPAYGSRRTVRQLIEAGRKHRRSP